MTTLISDLLETKVGSFSEQLLELINHKHKLVTMKVLININLNFDKNKNPNLILPHKAGKKTQDSRVCLEFETTDPLHQTSVSI